MCSARSVTYAEGFEIRNGSGPSHAASLRVNLECLESRGLTRGMISLLAWRSGRWLLKDPNLHAPFAESRFGPLLDSRIRVRRLLSDAAYAILCS